MLVVHLVPSTNIALIRNGRLTRQRRGCQWHDHVQYDRPLPQQTFCVAASCTQRPRLTHAQSE